MANVKKLYVAFKAGYLGNNILDTYFSFVANTILENQLTVVEDTDIATKFNERYAIELPMPFIRQVLGVGVQNKCFVEDHGKYSVVVEELEKYRFTETEFNVLWERIVREFTAYCQQKEIDVSSLEVGDFILSILDHSDDIILAGEKVEKQEGMPPVEYAWYSFAREQGEQQTELYSFIAALSASNITKQALFYTGDNTADYSDLHVYLDSPIVFALLGMDTEARTNSYKTLVADMLKAKCSIHVLDHNFQEVDGILARAANWAISTQYDLRYANNAARFFHDSQMSPEEISEFCESIETKLNLLGVTVKQTSFDVLQNDFQEDETCLFNMVKSRYTENGYELSKEKEESIRIDVRSIVMIYRERQGQTATRLQNAKHIMLTCNNAIANVSKQFESNRSIQSGHVPACISADLFGAVLWLNSPMQMLEYHKQKLLADCYAFLKPDKILLDNYIRSLDEARNEDDIDEKKFLFLRTHRVVLDALMDITKGDYARFTSTTYLEVYDEIQSRAEKLYRDEASAHKQTREEMEMRMRHSEDEIRRREEEITALKSENSALKEKEREAFNKKANRLGWISALLIVGIPYVASLVGVEYIKTLLPTVSWRWVIGIAGAIVLTIIAGVVFAKGKDKCFKTVRILLEKRK